jgi:TolB-like protein/Tfp pilus assembly protein PilF
MQIWSAEIKELESVYTFIKGKFPDLEKELEQLIKFDDANVILLYARRCLEVVITDLCECELKRPRKTEPLKGIIDKLSHEEKVPAHIISSMLGLNEISTYGAHPKDFDPEQIKPALSNLAIIIKWFIKYKESQNIDQAISKVEAKLESKEPDKIKEGLNKSKKRLIFLLSGIMLVAVITVVALFLFNIIGGKQETKDLVKSIGVLPFIDDSQDKENTAFINGIMEEVLINLQTIKDLRVPGRTSVEQYRNNETKSIPEIAKELDVNYIVEGSGQKYGNTFRLRVQLLDGAKGYHLWGDSYEQKIENVEDIFKIQNQIAESIAAELKAIITPEEKQLIEKAPTTSLTAYDFFQRGREEHWKYWLNGDHEGLEKAEELYHEALKSDSRFAQAYTGLSRVFWDKHYWETFFTEEFLDSVLILCDLALSIDNQLSEAYTIRGQYYIELGKREQAIKEFDNAIKLNPNDWMAYWQKGISYYSYDLVKTIDNYNKAISLNRGEQLPALLKDLGSAYVSAGFIEKARYYYQEALKLDGDSLNYNENIAWLEVSFGNYEKAFEFKEKLYPADTNTSVLYNTGYIYMFLRQHKEALKYFEKWLERSKTLSDIYLFGMHRVGWAYLKNGCKEKAEYYFNEQINYCNRVNKMGRVRGDPLRTAYDLAGAYAILGEKEKAYENLRIYNQDSIQATFGVNMIKTDPLFDSIRDEPEFQQIVRDQEAKYQAEHERVRKWLEEQGL